MLRCCDVRMLGWKATKCPFAFSRETRERTQIEVNDKSICTAGAKINFHSLNTWYWCAFAMQFSPKKYALNLTHA